MRLDINQIKNEVGKSFTDETDIANYFNYNFSKMGEKLAAKINRKTEYKIQRNLCYLSHTKHQ